MEEKAFSLDVKWDDKVVCEYIWGESMMLASLTHTFSALKDLTLEVLSSHRETGPFKFLYLESYWSHLTVSPHFHKGGEGGGGGNGGDDVQLRQGSFHFISLSEQMLWNPEAVSQSMERQEKLFHTLLLSGQRGFWESVGGWQFLCIPVLHPSFASK